MPSGTVPAGPTVLHPHPWIPADGLEQPGRDLPRGEGEDGQGGAADEQGIEPFQRVHSDLLGDSTRSWPEERP